MTSRTMLGKWFERGRGRVSGIEGIFVAFGFAIAPYFFSRAIGLLGWRGTWLTLAAIVGLGMSTIGWLLFRDNPEACGLQMDGDHLADQSTGQPTDRLLQTDRLWGVSRNQADQNAGLLGRYLSICLAGTLFNGHYLSHRQHWRRIGHS